MLDGAFSWKLHWKLLGGHLLWAGFLMSCQTAPPAVKTSPVVPLSPAAILQTLLQRQSEFKDLKSFIKTTVRTPRLNQTLRQALLIQGDRAIRFDTLSLLGQPLGVLVVEDQDVLFYDIGKSQLFSGVAVWDMMVQVFGTVIDFGKYIRILSGQIPGLETLEIKAVRLLADPAHYQIEAWDPVLRERLLIQLDARTLVPTQLQKWRGDQKVLTVQWEQHKAVNGQLFPHKIHLIRNDRGDELVIKFNAPQINQGVPADAFQLPLAGQRNSFPGSPAGNSLMARGMP